MANNKVKKNLNQLMNQLLTLQNQIKLYHWQTKSYARHKGADQLFTKMVELIDKVMEVYQGRYNTVSVNNKTNEIKLENLNDDNILEFLETMRDFFVKEFPEFVNKNTNTDLLNLRDEILANINQTIYLFGFK